MEFASNSMRKEYETRNPNQGIDSMYQKRAEAAAKAERDDTLAAIREALADVEAGRTKPARAALKALAKKYGVR